MPQYELFSSFFQEDDLEDEEDDEDEESDADLSSSTSSSSKNTKKNANTSNAEASLRKALLKHQQLKELASSSSSSPSTSSGAAAAAAPPPVDPETQARLEALLEAAGIGKQLTEETKQPFSDPEVRNLIFFLTVTY